MAKKRSAASTVPAEHATAGQDDNGTNGPDSGKPLTLVGVGASAGGLEAFTELLKTIPADSNLALVLVQHLSPNHPSSMAQLLAPHTGMTVVELQGDTSLAPNHVYVMPPNAFLSISTGVLQLQPRPAGQPKYSPIDSFFRFLAAEYQQRAIAVVLSGMGHDGTEGIREIKTAGGIALVQSPESAKFDAMPRAAIETGLADIVLPPERLGPEIVELSRQPYLQTKSYTAREVWDQVAPSEQQLARIFELLKANSGVDFSHYKLPTIQRRLQRRMALRKVLDVDAYLGVLNENPSEVTALYEDILIHVTRFFRDPASFDALTSEVFPKILTARAPDQPIRIWIPGCSTGAEPYSVGIALLEFLERQNASDVGLQIFATDVSELAIEYARGGFYPKAIAEDVSPERLRRFFVKSDGGYRINKTLRDVCIFARQDLTRDPPFSKLDLVVCRNVLIYLGAPLQSRLLNMFHYSLKGTGYLMLGNAESAGPYPDLFVVADKKHRLYKKRLVATHQSFHFSSETIRPGMDKRRKPTPEFTSTETYRTEANRIVMERYSPPGVVVDRDLQIIQFRGQTGPFLEPAPGDANLNLLRMAREGLLHGLRSAIHTTRKSGQPTRKEGLRVQSNGGYRSINLNVIPLGTAESAGYLLVLFEPASPPNEPDLGKLEPANPDLSTQQLEQELASTQQYLQSIIQEHESAHEELQSANEEILSSNEELQSTNEELDTAREELQSTNEELNTLNEELHGRNDELSRSNSDLVNLLGSMQIAIVIVTRDLRIRRYTPVAEKVLNLISADIGRPIGHIKPNINCPDLEKLIGESIESVSPQQRTCWDNNGKTYSLTIRPYKNTDNRIDGAVLALVDVDELRLQTARADEATWFAEAVVETVMEPVIVLDDQFNVRMVNRAFGELFAVERGNLRGQPLFDMAGGLWNVSALRELLSGVLEKNKQFENYRLEADFPRIGRKVLLLNARRMDAVPPHSPYVLLAMQDRTEG